MKNNRNNILYLFYLALTICSSIDIFALTVRSNSTENNTITINNVYRIPLKQINDYLPTPIPISKSSRFIVRHNAFKRFIKIWDYAVFPEKYQQTKESPYDFFKRLDISNTYTYVITKDELIISESSKRKGLYKIKDLASKHYLLSNQGIEVFYAGEVIVRKVEAKIIIIFTNNSGTYTPNENLLPKLLKLIKVNFTCHEDEVEIRTLTYQEQNKVKDIPPDNE